MILADNTNTISDKQWFESGGYKAGRPIQSMKDPNRMDVGTLNDPNWAIDPERALIESVLMGRIDDAIGRGQYAAWVCDECHFDRFDCGCQTVRLDCKPSPRKNQTGSCVAWINGHRRVFPVDKIAQFDDGFWYYRGILQKCHNAPTLQDCALDWFGLGRFPVAKECVATCDELGVDLEYVRSYILREKTNIVPKKLRLKRRASI